MSATEILTGDMCEVTKLWRSSSRLLTIELISMNRLNSVHSCLSCNDILFSLKDAFKALMAVVLNPGVITPEG
jgi:hypothetical protein